MPSFGETESYVHRIAAEPTLNGRALAPGAALPRTSPRETRRISHSPHVRRQLFDARGHTVAKRLGPGTDEHISVAIRREQRL